jgi:ribosomal protein S18 acetylase RimI-like enzyme
MDASTVGGGAYRLVDGPPTATDFLLLRRRAGLTPPRVDQVELGVGGAWAAVSVVEVATGATVGMGRVLGDGGWQFHIVDMAVLPEHQRRGLGDAILAFLLDQIRRGAPPGAYVSLGADPPGRRLYERHGFIQTAPHTVSMARILQ